jgi:hypothetical protein
MLHNQTLPHLEEIQKVYRLVTQYPTLTHGFGGSPFPTFDELFEELVTLFIEEKTRLRNDEIDEELYQLKLRGALDVEQGFNPERYGLNKEMELFEGLNAMNFTFLHNGVVYNAPILEVW